MQSTSVDTTGQRTSSPTTFVMLRAIPDRLHLEREARRSIEHSSRFDWGQLAEHGLAVTATARIADVLVLAANTATSTDAAAALAAFDAMPRNAIVAVMADESTSRHRTPLPPPAASALVNPRLATILESAVRLPTPLTVSAVVNLLGPLLDPAARGGSTGAAPRSRHRDPSIQFPRSGLGRPQ